jgi:methylmalonyl-CoA mutase cobalamin-binding subunit
VLQGADLIDLHVRAVGFDQLHVGMFVRRDELARSALEARSGRVGRSAVEGQRQRSRQRRFANLRWAADQIGVRRSIICDGAIETEDGPVVSADRPLGRGHASIITMNNVK